MFGESPEHEARRQKSYEYWKDKIPATFSTGDLSCETVGDLKKLLMELPDDLPISVNNQNLLIAKVSMEAAWPELEIFDNS
jgi:hypothetical protein